MPLPKYFTDYKNKRRFRLFYPALNIFLPGPNYRSPEQWEREWRIHKAKRMTQIYRRALQSRRTRLAKKYYYRWWAKTYAHRF